MFFLSNTLVCFGKVCIFEQNFGLYGQNIYFPAILGFVVGKCGGNTHVCIGDMHFLAMPRFVLEKCAFSSNTLVCFRKVCFSSNTYVRTGRVLYFRPIPRFVLERLAFSSNT